MKRALQILVKTCRWAESGKAVLLSIYFMHFGQRMYPSLFIYMMHVPCSRHDLA